MATYTGQDGVISIGGDTVAQVTSFSIEHTTNTIEKTAMGDVYREYSPGVSEWSGSADIFITDTDSSNGLYANLVPGTSGTVGSPAVAALIAYPSGNNAGNPKVTGNVVITGFSVSSEVEGMVTGSISFQGTGAMTYTTA